MKKPIKIGCDLDNVLGSFHMEFSKHLRNLYGDHLPLLGHDKEIILNWDWQRWFPITEHEFEYAWKVLENDIDFYLRMPLLDKEDWEYFKEHINNNNDMYDTYFITSRKSFGGISAVKQSTEWLINHGWKQPHVIESNKKGMVVHALEINAFIDDSGKNCMDVFENAPNCDLIAVFDYPHNRKPYPDKIKRVNNLREFVDKIKK